MKHLPLFILCSILAFTPASQSHAGIVTWDPLVAGTSWDTPEAWLGGALPDDEALLGDVSSGLRTITVDAPASLAILSMTQNAVGATNRLDISSTLTLSGNATPFKLTSAEAGANLQINVLNNGLLRAERASGSITANLNAALSVASTGRVEVVNTSGVATTNLTGPVQLNGGKFLTQSNTNTAKLTASDSFTAEANSQIEVNGNTSQLEFTGDTHLKAGSQILLQYKADAQFSNKGTLLMEGTDITYDWTAATTGNPGALGRNFINSGSWTLANNSSIKLISTTNLATNGGFNTLTSNSNTGTLKVQSGSQLLFRTLYNSGILEAGSATGSISDTRVSLGGNQITSGITLHNGIDPAGAAKSGTLTIKGDAILGHSSEVANGGTTLLNNGSGSSTGSLLKVGDDLTPLTFIIGASTRSEIHNYAGNRIEIREQATLDLKVYTPSGSALGYSTLTNAGTLQHSGTLKLQGNLSSGAKTIDNSGSYFIRGTDSTLVNSPNPNGGTNASAITFTTTGTFGGSTTNDRLTYSNLSGNANRDILTLSLNGGTLAPGNGTGSASSVGALALVNTSIAFSNAARLTLDIAGTSGSSLFDTLTLSGEGATIDLGNGTILDIRLADGALLEGTYRLITAAGISGTISEYLLNGASATGFYTVDIHSTYIDLTAIPEPSTLLSLLGATSLLILLRGRKQRD